MTVRELRAALFALDDQEAEVFVAEEGAPVAVPLHAIIRGHDGVGPTNEVVLTWRPE